MNITIERARKLVRQYTGFRKGQEAIADAIAAHMVSTGACVWHATHVITKSEHCGCRDCATKRVGL